MGLKKYALAALLLVGSTGAYADDITVTLSEPELNVIVQALAARPYGEVSAIIPKIVDQYKAAKAKTVAPPPTTDKK